jgi:outer membrane protein assembly factor BamB
LDPDNTVRFQIKNLVLPLDAQLLDDDRVLIAEYHGNRVTERNTRTGEILWQRAVASPLVAQRLANGNTFVATPHDLIEYDKDGQQVLNVSLSPDNQYIMKAFKLASGEMVCMCADARMVRYDAAGKERSSFSIPLGQRLFGGRIQVLPSGRVLVPHNAEGKVREYDSSGKVMWEIPFEAPIAASRLPNGHTLITSMNAQVGAVEVDRAGTPVWNYQHISNTRVTRAFKR